MKRPLVIFFLTLVTGLGLSGCVNRGAQAQSERTVAILNDPVIPVKVMRVGTQSMVEYLGITGAINNTDDATITANVPGKLVSVFVKEGDKVVAGQLLAVQESVDERASVRQSQANVNAARSRLDEAQTAALVGPRQSATAIRAARAQLRQAELSLLKAKNGARPEEKAQAEASLRNAKSQLDLAKRALDRAEALFKDGAISARERDAAQAQYSNALSAYESAIEAKRLVLNATRTEDISIATSAVTLAREGLQQALDSQRLDISFSQRVQQAEAAVVQAQESLNIAMIAEEDCRIKAPMSGKVIGKPAQPGQYLGPGTPFVRLIGQSGIYFEGDVPESKINLIKQGMQVVVSLQAVANTKLSGKVVAINPASGSLGRLFKVRIVLDSTPDSVKTGMFASGKIELSRDDSAIVIPQNSLLKDADNEYVFVLNGDLVQRITVKSLKTEGDNVQVSGLPTGKMLVVSGQQLVKNGGKVKVETNSDTKLDSAATPATEVKN